MKRNRLFAPIGIVLFLALSLLGHSQTAGSSLPYESVPLAVTWPSFSVGTTSTNPIPTTGINYFQILVVPSGTVSTCSISVDGATVVGGTFSTGSIVSAGTIGSCASPVTYTTPSAVTPSVQGRVTVTMTGTGTVTVTVLGSNVSLAGGGSSVTVSSPVDGSGYVNVDCKTGCSGSSNPNGQATMANSAPVTFASNQSTLNVAAQLAQPAATSGSITSTTCPGSGCVSLATAGYGSVSFSVHGTYTGVSVIFEFSDDGGTTWYTNTCSPTGTATLVTTVVVANNGTNSFDCGAYSTTNERIRATAYGSGTVTVNATPTAASVEPAATVAAVVTDNAGNGIGSTAGALNTAANVNQVGGSAISLYATMLNAVIATGTATSSAVRAPAQSAGGVLTITGASITGSPSGCQIALEQQQNTGGPVSSAFFTQAFTPGNSYQSFLISPPNSSAGSDSLIAVYTCGTYPTAGTISVTFAALSQQPLTLDSAGNVKMTAGAIFSTLAAWNSGTSLNSTQTLTSNSAAGAVLVQLDQTTTVTGGAVTFQCTYDGINWVTCPQVTLPTTNVSAPNPYTLVASTNQPFLISPQGAVGARILLSTAITGTATVTPYVTIVPQTASQIALLLGHTGLGLDSTSGGALTGGVVATAGESQTSGANGAIGTSAKMARPLADDSGQAFVIPGGSFRYSAFITLSTNTTTQIQAAPGAGLFNFVTGVVFNTRTAGTSTTAQLEYGTGANCVTSPVALTPTFPTTVGVVSLQFNTPLVPAANNAICAVQAGTTAGTVDVLITGYIEP